MFHMNTFGILDLKKYKIKEEDEVQGTEQRKMRETVEEQKPTVVHLEKL